MEYKDFKIEIYLPEGYIEDMRKELNDMGACRVGDYDNVISFSEVKGYWRPLESTTPFHGNKGDINFGSECKMEIRCGISYIKNVLDKIYEIHPYEEPLVNVIPLINSYFRE
ncbi:cytochrome C biogenesis protein [Clostridium sp. D2Q-11]|uniref:Cytochrome C biogenesis protein n=1 Tax=Anaeromonas frigoriresistens TaxID=2683708 RepID=A0A942UU49_9FIRM|nr:cytochrome C biogenesis protein [Anaeromonas frigoriresistens]MBS4537505.1 cytochrome C biogenesis protein [Anaeromonas frigoriresistens]